MQEHNFSQLGCVVMASGLATRFGSNKLLAKLQNKTLIEHTLNILKRTGLSNIIIVTRSQEVAQLVTSLGYQALLHKLPYQSDTVALGTKYWLAKAIELQGLVFITGDQPLLLPTTLLHLCRNFLADNSTPKIHRLAKEEQGIIIPGNPVIFSSELFPKLCQLPQDKGGSVLCKKYPQLVKILLATPEELLDVDTLEDLEYIKKLRA